MCTLLPFILFSLKSHRTVISLNEKFKRNKFFKNLRRDITPYLCTFQAETDDLYRKIHEYENSTKDSNKVSDKFDADIRDMSKKVQKLEVAMEETLEKLQAANSKLENAEKDYKDKEEDVNAQVSRWYRQLDRPFSYGLPAPGSGLNSSYFG